MIPQIECPECESLLVTCLDRDTSVYYCQECGLHFDYEDELYWVDLERFDPDDDADDE